MPNKKDNIFILRGFSTSRFINFAVFIPVTSRFFDSRFSTSRFFDSRFFYRRGFSTDTVKHDLDKANVVYRLKCLLCKDENCSYIGETSRVMKERWAEHISDRRKGLNSTGPTRHAKAFHGSNFASNWELNILAVCKTNYERKIKDSLAIDLQKAKINQKSGIFVIRI